MKIKPIGNVMTYEIDAFGTLVIAVFFFLLGVILLVKLASLGTITYLNL